MSRSRSTSSSPDRLQHASPDHPPPDDRTVYLDPRAMAIGGAAAGAPRLSPDAAAAMRHLVDAGLRVVLVGDGPPLAMALAALPEGTPVAADLPEDSTGWLLTSDPGMCLKARSRRGVRTVLIGPSLPDVGLSHRPSDVAARDLIDAVLTILGAEAMPERA